MVIYHYDVIDEKDSHEKVFVKIDRNNVNYLLSEVNSISLSTVLFSIVEKKTLEPN